MAEYKFVTDVNINGNVIRNAKVESFAGLPQATNTPGRIIFDSNVNRFAFCNGSAWIYATEVKSINGSNTVKLIDSTTNNIITLRELSEGDYITISNSGGIINLSLDYQSLWEYFEQLRFQSHWMTAEQMNTKEDFVVGELIFCTTQGISGLYQFAGRVDNTNRWSRISNEYGVFIRNGQVTEDMLAPAYKQSLQAKFDDMQEQIDNQIFTIGFTREDGSVWIEVGEHNSQIDSAELNSITGAVTVYFNFD